MSTTYVFGLVRKNHTRLGNARLHDKRPRRRATIVVRFPCRPVKQTARPQMHFWLAHSLLIPDLASIGMGYVDGQEKAQPAAAVAAAAEPMPD
jgi:hypothetical protein